MKKVPFYKYLLLFFVLLSVGCNIESPPGLSSCSPYYSAPSAYGSFTAQQAGKGQSIQWGIYPNFPASNYILTVYAGSKIVDRKNQIYPPHASVSAVDLVGKSGQLFRVVGDIYGSTGGVALSISLACIIA